MIFGPIIKSIEKVLYKLPFFIKHVPVNERPQYIEKMIAGPGRVVATDYSSYEASFTPPFCLAIEYEIYYFVANGFIAEIICKSFYLFNTCIFREFRIRILAKRMSGDVNTSLGNGVSNVVVIMFVVWVRGRFWLLAVIVEGDDSLFRVPRHLDITTDDFAEFGLIVKIEESEDVNLASFCGNVYSRQDLKMLVEPGRVFRRFGYIDRKYKNARQSKKLGLLRAYAFSIYYMYHGCPMVASLAKYLLRVTRGVYANMKTIDMHRFAEGEVLPASEERMFALYPPDQVGEDSRRIVSQLYGYSLDAQRRVEKYLDQCTDLHMLDIPDVLSRSHPDAKLFFQHYQVHSGQDVNRIDPDPSIPLSKLIDDINWVVKNDPSEERDVLRSVRHTLALASAQVA